MAKRNFAALMLLSITTIVAANNSRAHDAFNAADGCAELARLVHAEVTSNAWDTPDVITPMLDDAGDANFSICIQTTRTVSKAFASAMTSIGTPVRWGYPGIEPGDVCLSVYLDQCYPNRNRLGGTTRFWSAVSKTVKQAMPYGEATDLSIFNASTLRQALRSALADRAAGVIAPLAESPREVGARAIRRRPR